MEDIKKEIFTDLKAYHKEIQPDASPYDMSYKDILKSYYKFPALFTPAGGADAFKHP